MDLKNKVAIVSGASKGIGLELCKQLLDKGAKVYGLSRSNNPLNHPGFVSVSLDIRDYNQVRSTVQTIIKDQGQVDVLVNNAGLGYFGYLEDTTLEEWHQMYDTNVNGLFYLCKEVIPGMKEKGYGHIFNIASTAGIEGYPQTAAYSGTKFAVRGMSQALYKELRDHKIKVTCVYPGSTKTNFFDNTPIQIHDYMLMPQDVATMMVQSLEMPDNFHQVNLEVRPLQPRGPKN